MSFVPQRVNAGFISSFTEKVRSIFFVKEEIIDAISSETSQTISLFKASNFGVEEAQASTYSDNSESLAVTTGSMRTSTEDVVYPTDDTINVYEVKKGDTLSEVAEMFGVSRNTIMWANDLKSSTVSPGDVLLILPVTGIRHTVKKGDTIKSITKKYKANEEDILTYNGIASSKELAVGDVVIVPDGEIESIAPKKTTTTKKPTIYTNITVRGFLARPLIGGIKTQGIHGNNGVDIGAPAGTNVLASASGRVLIARGSGYNGGYGSMVIIDHGNGVQTLYSHLSSVGVSTGQNVVQGQVIGGVGNTGKSTGNHLHFEVRGAKNPF